jgi:RHS repeat-associated protein
VSTWSDTAITVTVPNTATSGPLLVVVNNQVSNGVDFTAPPVIGSLSPSSGVAGTLLTINGTNLGGAQGSNTISIAGIPATASAWTATSIQVPIPSGAPTGDVVVTVNSVPSNGSTFVFNPTNGIVTSFQYDAKGQLISTTDPLNHTTTIAYTPIGGTAPAGLVQTVTDALNNATQLQYDAAGNKTKAIDPAQNRISYVYDAMNRLVTVTFADTSTNQFTYDTRGRKVSFTDGNQTVTGYAYDDADRLVTVTDANNGITTYSYDNENNLTGITDELQRQTVFAYDDQGHVLLTIFPSHLTESYAYDALGNMLSKADRKNQTTKYSYDALNRLVLKQYPDSTTVSYVYDLANRLTSISDTTGTYGFSFDPLGRLTGTTTRYSFLPTTFTSSYGYDAASNRTSFTAPDGGSNTYVYDALNRITSLSNSLTGQFTFGYDNLSRRTDLNRPNGVNTTYVYDSLSQLLTVLHKAGTVTLDGTGYTYDNAGNRTAKTNYLSNITEQYTYDPTYQLTQVTQGATTTESYSYDAVGNRLSSLGMSPYVYNSSNEVTSTSAATFSYDGNGNMVTKADSSGTTTYNWDFEDRLTSVVLPSSGTVTFKYDPFGRRIQKTSSSGTTNYLYDGANSIEEVDGAGALVVRYAQSAGIDEPLAELRGGTTGFYDQDGLGSVTSLSSLTASVVDSYTYDSFGNVTASTNALMNPFQYTGRDFDSETGLRYYRARYYEPQIGRFISEDPMRFGAGENFYSYADGSPTNFIDAFGLTIGVMGDSGSVNVALQYLSKDPQSKKMIDAMQKSSTVYTIITTSSFRANYSDPNDDPNIIYWNPNLALECEHNRYGETGAIRTPSLALGHELYHVYTQSWWHERLSLSKDPWWMNLDEKRVIDDYENPAAKVLGEPGQRQDHGGKPVWVPTPTTQPKCNCSGAGHSNGYSL